MKQCSERAAGAEHAGSIAVYEGEEISICAECLKFFVTYIAIHQSEEE